MWSEGGRLVFHQRVERGVVEGCGCFGVGVVVRVWEVVEVMVGDFDGVVDGE